MDFHLENKVRLTKETTYQSLYPWCLQEIDEDGHSISEDLIPWQWSLTFTASEMRLLKQVTYGDTLSKDDEGLRFKTAESIHASLYSGTCRDGHQLEDDVYLSMLGTSRGIENISLFIDPVDNIEQEQCEVWGTVSYTSDIECKSETTSDTLEIYLTLTRARFDMLAQCIESKSLDIVTLRLSDISGVYSSWSPISETHMVKLLTRDSEHQVILPVDCDVEPPRLGTVGKFGLALTSRCPLNPKQDLEPLDISSEFKGSLLDEGEGEAVTPELKDSLLDEGEAVNPELEDKTDLFLYKLSNAQAELIKLRAPLWLIVILLASILISNHW
ncbi:hypothetical protein ACNO65_25275 [Vibrio campbellii]|uniref:hypothetical protein n=1 Tax=Vibrio campbellii TaxID=680 RepID=UPI00249AABB6|nr:hypothetical protein [Vibrio campbellii]